MSSTAVNYHTGRKQAKEANRQSDAAAYAEYQRQQAIKEDLRKVRSGFGISDIDTEKVRSKLDDLRARMAGVPATVTQQEPVTFRQQSSGSAQARNPPGSYTPAPPRTTEVANPYFAVADAEMRALNRQLGEGTEAEQNRRRTDEFLSGLQKENVAQGFQSVQDALGDARVTNRRELARRGLTGGSVDAATRRKNLSELIGGRQQVVADAAGSRQQDEQNLVTRRQNLEQMVQGGSLSDVGDNFAIEEQARLRSGASQVIPQALGDLFSQVGGVVYQDQLAQGAGRRGVFTSRRAPKSSGGGNITGGK